MIRMEQRIPKIIHYCWFGGNPKPPLVIRCIDSWKRFCPEYEIIEWNENNYDIHSNTFVEGAYHEKKWAFVSDCVRADILLKHGGVYLDTDIEIVRPIDLLHNNSFFAGFETKDTVAAGVIGCVKGNKTIELFAEYYKDRCFSRTKDQSILTSPLVLTDVLKKEGLKLNGRQQSFSDCTIYPKVTFYPTGIRWVFGNNGPRTIMIHHYMDSWGKNAKMAERTRRSKMRLCLLYCARNILGTNTMYKLGKRIQKMNK